MSPNILVLGGTTEATALCQRLVDAGIRGTISFAGRVARPALQPLPQRVGGFGGVAGLMRYLQESGFTHLVDATHPFAAQMSANAVAACAETGVPLIALTRAPWTALADDDWRHVPDIAGAVDALTGPPRRIMLAIGRMHLDAFIGQPQHFYLLRLVDPPMAPPPFPDHHVVVERGPFTVESDLKLLTDHRIDIVLSKNAGGKAAVAKIAAARQLGLPVIMIDRPVLPDRRETHDPGKVMDWIAHAGTDRGV